MAKLALGSAGWSRWKEPQRPWLALPSVMLHRRRGFQSGLSKPRAAQLRDQLGIAQLAFAQALFGPRSADMEPTGCQWERNSHPVPLSAFHSHMMRSQRRWGKSSSGFLQSQTGKAQPLIQPAKGPTSKASSLPVPSLHPVFPVKLPLSFLHFIWGYTIVMDSKIKPHTGLPQKCQGARRALRDKGQRTLVGPEDSLPAPFPPGRKRIISESRQAPALLKQRQKRFCLGNPHLTFTYANLILSCWPSHKGMYFC